MVTSASDVFNVPCIAPVQAHVCTCQHVTFDQQMMLLCMSYTSCAHCHIRLPASL